MTHFTVAILRHLAWAAVFALAAAGAHAQSPAIPEKVTLQLKWKHQFQFAGYYAALEQGYYRDAGFDVAIREADEAHDPVDAVLAGQADFGVGASDLVLRRGRGQPVVVVAVILQHSPLVLIARGGGVRTVHDLAGKRVMLLPHETELYAYLQREGLPRERIVEVPHTFTADDLVKGKVEALSGYSTDEPFVLNQIHFAYSLFSPRASGVDFYGDSLFTLESRVRSAPARVAAFRDASLRGWQYAMSHQEEIADLILARYSRRHSREHLLFEADEMRRLMQPQLIEIGHINPGRWQGMAQVYAEFGMIPANYSLDGFLFDPESRPDLTWLYRWLAIAVAVAVAGSLVAAWTSTLNRRLKRQLDEINELKLRLEEQAIRDSLTGLHNRRYFDDAIDREIARARRDGYPISLALIDLDRFKRLNDQYGHQAGDEVLRTVARHLDAITRASDLVCRWGGEEFVVLLPRTSLASALQRADAWRAGFEAAPVRFEGRDIRATFSIGIAASRGESTSAAELLRAADGELYRAKSEGRNCVRGAEQGVA